MMSILDAYGLTWWQTVAMGIGFLSLITLAVVFVKYFFTKILPAMLESLLNLFKRKVKK
jgi:hypothetical protein